MTGYLRSYTIDEDNLILEWIVKSKLFYQLRGRNFWVDLSNANIFNERTWMSLQNRFQNHVLPDMWNPNYTLSTLDKKKVVLAWNQTAENFNCGREKSDSDCDTSSNDDDIDVRVSLECRMDIANLVLEKAEEYLQKMNNDLENTKDEDLYILSEQFPIVEAYIILEKFPNLTEQYENLATKYAERGVVGPLYVLWTSYFMNENLEKANQIVTEYLKDSPGIMFQKIVDLVRDLQNEIMAKKMIQYFKNNTPSEEYIGNGYSCLLNVLLDKENYQEVVNTFEEARKSGFLSYLNRIAIHRSKEAFEKLGKPFNYIVPPNEDVP